MRKSVSSQRRLSVEDDSPAALPPVDISAKESQSSGESDNKSHDNVLGTAVVSPRYTKLIGTRKKRSSGVIPEYNESTKTSQSNKKRLSFASETKQYEQDSCLDVSSIHSAEEIVTSASSEITECDTPKVDVTESVSLTDVEEVDVNKDNEKSNASIVEGEKGDEEDAEYEEVEEEIEEEIEVEEEEEEEASTWGEGEEGEEIEEEFEGETDESKDILGKDEEAVTYDVDVGKGDEREQKKDVTEDKELEVVEEINVDEEKKKEEPEEVKTDKKQEIEESGVIVEKEIGVRPKRKTKTVKIIKKVKVKKEKVEKFEPDVVKPEPETLIPENLEETDNQLETKLVADQVECEKYIDMIKSKISELTYARRKNKILHRYLIDYFKHKKMEYVYEEGGVTSETAVRYYKKLKVLDDLINATTAEKQRKLSEVDAMKSVFERHDNEFKKELTEFLKWEEDVGKSVVDSSSGKKIDGQIIEHLIQRHESVINQLSAVRLILIKLQNQITIKENILKGFINLEGNLNLIDYEQLRMDNQNFADKIEEREDELLHLREKMLAVIHTYAHVLEKSDAIQEDIESCRAKLHYIDSNVNSVRENVNKLKQHRDGLRKDTRKMRKTAGLLIQPRLAVDYADSLKKIDEGTIKLESIIKRFHLQRSKILELRKFVHTDSIFDELELQ